MLGFADTLVVVDNAGVIVHVGVPERVWSDWLWCNATIVQLYRVIYVHKEATNNHYI